MKITIDAVGCLGTMIDAVNVVESIKCYVKDCDIVVRVDQLVWKKHFDVYDGVKVTLKKRQKG